MHNLRITPIVAALSACMAIAPITAHHHRSSIAAGFMGAGLGMMAGLALGDHHSHNHSHDCCHHKHVVKQPKPHQPVYTYEYAYPCYYTYNYPCQEVYVYDDYMPYRHTFYDYPCTEIHARNTHQRPSYHSSFSLGFFL